MLFYFICRLGTFMKNSDAVCNILTEKKVEKMEKVLQSKALPLNGAQFSLFWISSGGSLGKIQNRTKCAPVKVDALGCINFSWRSLFHFNSFFLSFSSFLVLYFIRRLGADNSWRIPMLSTLHNSDRNWKTPWR